MLLQFRFQNFLSFKDEAIIDMTATKGTEFKDHIVHLGQDRILPVAAIYGANASGKSNILAAFHYMNRYVRDSLNYGGKSESDEYEMRLATPFLLHSESASGVSLFEVYFNAGQDNMTYNYGFTIDKTGVREEWLNKQKSNREEMRCVFYRDDETLDLSGIEEERRDNLKVSLNRETLIVSLGATLKIEILETVKNWFAAQRFVDFGDSGENFIRSHMMPKNFVNEIAVQQKTVKFLSSFDRGIQNFVVQKVDNEEKRSSVKIQTVHRMMDSSETTTFPFGVESTGTLEMFSLYPTLYSALASGSVMIIDEIHAHLHPLLVRSIIGMFLDRETNPNHAQLIFATHDAWQLNSGLLRRDEIWFVDKDENGCSSVYSLAEFEDEDGEKIRKDENYMKNYLVGKYGGIPELKPFNFFKE